MNETMNGTCANAHAKTEEKESGENEIGTKSQLYR